MSVITIPKEFTKGEELVVIPRRIYDDVLRFWKAIPKTKISPLEKRLQQALREVQSGKTIGPFSTLAEGLRVLKQHA